MGRLLAVAGLTVRAALRVRLFWAVAALLVVVGLLVPPALRDDGTLVGRARLLLTYSLGLSQALLCLAAVWLGADSLCRDVRDGHVLLTATKPLARWQMWLGKWLGLWALEAALLLVAAAAAAVQLEVAVRSSRWTVSDRERLADELMTVREVVRPELPDFAVLADARLRERVQSGDLPPEEAGTTEARDAARRIVTSTWQSVAPQATKRWTFRNVRTPAGGREIRLHYRFRAGAYVGPEGIAGQWSLGGEGGRRPAVARVQHSPDRWHVVEAPADVVGPNGVLLVEYRNEAQETVAFPIADGPDVRYVVGGFGGNLGRALLLLWFQLAMLTALGLAAGSALSFPVAAFAALAYLAVAAHAPLLAGRLAEGERVLAGGHHTAPPEALEQAAQAAVGFGLWLTGSLYRFGPISALAAGVNVPWAKVGGGLLHLGLLQTGLLAAVGILLWSSRELAPGVER